MCLPEIESQLVAEDFPPHLNRRFLLGSRREQVLAQMHLISGKRTIRQHFVVLPRDAVQAISGESSVEEWFCRQKITEPINNRQIELYSTIANAYLRLRLIRTST